MDTINKLSPEERFRILEILDDINSKRNPLNNLILYKPSKNVIKKYSYPEIVECLGFLRIKECISTVETRGGNLTPGGSAISYLFDLDFLKLIRLREELLSFTKIIFNEKIGTLTFKCEDIKIGKNTNEYELCKIIFKNQTSLLREWNWQEIIKKWGDTPQISHKRKVSQAGRRINHKIAEMTGVKDLFITKELTIQVNPLYLQ